MWQSGLFNAEAAGLSYGLGFSFNPATKLGFLTNIGESEEYAIGMQLLQLAFKQERKFDWKSLITAALTAEANDAIAHIPGFQQNPGGTFFHPAPPNLRNTFASTFTDDFITSEVETRHFNAEDAAAQALGTVAGLALAQEARNVHNDYKNKQEQKLLQSYYADQDFQKTRQRINATDAALESFGEAQDADFKAMLNTNPFTGEPLDATDPMDPSQQSDDKTPSYQQRQEAHDQSQSKAQQWNAQVNQNTFGSRNSGGFLQDLNAGLDFITKMDAETEASLLSLLPGMNNAKAASIINKTWYQSATGDSLPNNPEQFDAAEQIGQVAATGIALATSLITGGTAISKWGSVINFFASNAQGPIPTADSAQNIMNGIRLRQQLTEQQYFSFLNSDGTLLPDTIKNSRGIMPATELGNSMLKEELQNITGSLEGWGKYVTQPQIPHLDTGENFSVHFYYNSITNDVYYGMDYKMVFQNGTQIPIEVEEPEINFQPQW